MTPDDRRDESSSPGGEERPDPAEAIAAEYADRLIAGERIGADEILSAHPTLGAEILEHLQVFVGLGGPDPKDAVRTLGDYTLRRQIGRGGMGVVYEAWQGSMDRVVALKVLPPGVAADGKAFVRFLREAKTAGQLSHPNVVAVYSTGVEEGTPWYSMEYVEGETLAQILRRMRAAGPDAPNPFGASREELAFYSLVARAFADVADGLQHAHSRGVVHRDIKPSNLILDRGARSRADGGTADTDGSGSSTRAEASTEAFPGRLRILDFGLARLEGQESLSASGDFVGTPLYMSPEQARRRKVPVDHRTDVYSLGATLYEVLTLEPPFRGKDHEDTLSQIIQREPRPPRQSNPRVPRDLETIVLKCLRKDVGERYGTAEALGQDLRRFVRGDPIEARVQTRWEKLAQQLWRRRRSVLAAAAVVMLLVVGLGVGTVVVAGAYRAVRAERDARMWDLYVSDMRLASSDLDSGYFARFETLLDRHRPKTDADDLRGWEWYYLQSIRDTGSVTLQVDPRGVLSVDWFPGGNAIATGSADGTVQVWDVTTGRRSALYSVASPPAKVVAWSPDGKRLSAMDRETRLYMWDAARGEQVFSVAVDSVPGRNPDAVMAWSPTGELIATGTGNPSGGSGAAIAIRNAADGSLHKSLLANAVGRVIGVAWNHRGSRFAAIVPGYQAVVWNAHSWEEDCRLSPSNHAQVFSMAWSADDNRLVTASNGGEVTIWDAETWRELSTQRLHSDYILSLAFSPASTAEGHLLASGGTDGIVRVSRPFAEEVEVTHLRGHTHRVWRLAWKADGMRLASASTDGTVRIWDTTTTDDRKELLGMHPAVWSPDGRYIASAGSPGLWGVQVFDTVARTTAWKRYCMRAPGALAFSPNSALLAAGFGGDAIVIWEWPRDAEVKRIDGRHGTSDATCVADWSPDGASLATGGADGVARIWECRTWELLRELHGHEERVGSARWSPDGTRLATTSPDLSLKIWDTKTWSVLHALERSPPHWEPGQEGARPGYLAWSPDGRQLAAAVDKGTPGFVVFDAVTGERTLAVEGDTSGMCSIAWSPDGQRLATGSLDRTVRIWSAATGDELVTLHGHAGWPRSLGWHPSGRLLFSADERTGVMIWDASKGYER